MSQADKGKPDRGLRDVAIPSLGIIKYPDRRLRRPCAPVVATDEAVRRLAERMFELMFAAKGIGLAACQAGVNVQLFVACLTGEPADRRVYVNPKILAAEGAQEEEEGCLSVPGVTCKIKRPGVVAIRATDLGGAVFEETAEGLAARVFQHEMDHLDGRLILDRMGSVAKLAMRRVLKDLEEEFSTREGSP